MRTYYLDILKGFGVFYVVLGHIVHIPLVVQYIYSFHVPMFFFISGVLFTPAKYTSTSQYIQKKVNSLLLPYFFFYTVSLAYWYLVEYRLFGRGGDTTLLQEFYFMFSGCVSIAAGALWFLPCLFWVEVLYWFMHHERRKYQGLVCAIIMAVIGTTFIYYQFYLQVFGLLQSFVVIPFFAIGYLLKSKMDALFQSCLMVKLSVVCIAVLVQYLLLADSKFNIGSFEIESHCTYIPIALAGITFYLMFSFIIKRAFLLEWLGRNSLFIFSFHALIYRGVIVMASVCLSISQSELRESLAYSILLTLVTLITMIPMVYIYNHWVAPRLSSYSLIPFNTKQYQR